MLILAAVVEIFVWGPWRQRVSARKAVGDSPVPGPPVAALGADAVSLAGLSEVADASLSLLDGLSPGATVAQAAQVEVSADRCLPVEVVNSAGMHFRLIPNGTYLMGSPDTEPGRMPAEVQHVRGIKTPFYMGKWEVTQSQWDTVMGEDRNPSGFRHPRRPVEEVTWYDCQRFVLALSEKEGLPRWTYRLPSEAEWEYACRAGSTQAYHYGNAPARLEEFDFFNVNSYGRTQFCGQKRANAYGLHDTHGNVWEWCRNMYKEYPGPELASEQRGEWRGIRGGNFYVGAADCRCAMRSSLPPDSHGNVLGFRVVRIIPELFEGVMGGVGDSGSSATRGSQSTAAGAGAVEADP